MFDSVIRSSSYGVQCSAIENPNVRLCNWLFLVWSPVRQKTLMPMFPIGSSALQAKPNTSTDFHSTRAFFTTSLLLPTSATRGRQLRLSKRWRHVWLSKYQNSRYNWFRRLSKSIVDQSHFGN